MLHLMITFALVVLGLAIAVGNPVTNERWTNFKEIYAKSYATVKEEIYRHSVFEQNLLFVEEHNQRFTEGLETYNVRINKFGDMTDEEFFSEKTGFFPLDFEPTTPGISYSSDNVREYLDWRDEGAVNEVRNQGSCGSCYAFSAISSLESHHYLKTGDLVELSEQNAMDCVDNATKTNDGCKGGNHDKVFDYIASNGGIDTRESYPYEKKDAECRFDPANIGATCYGHVKVPKDEDSLLVAVNDIGPVSVGLYAGGPGFHHYESGVYYNASCPKNDGNHAMVVIGFGTEEVGGDYWLVRNSWGQDFGLGGYIKMARNADNQCGVANHASYPIV